ncbi:flavodoxin family protein [Anaerocolumna chitinilytica]|uniref:Flavodoxin family protein n=1 Tax=Anaerocolumna chitinilytica TaxID=1727145 RepID=A0A7M3S9A7_9FIRM|nr:flavodoxin family protein [Anaerocolumna chitinilytica]BCK01175.1 hypothetical protein bsdcttw_42150 [Anaerocolumna chitinilytica]
MRLLVHDLTPQEFEALGLELSPETTVISDDGTIKPCIGCFGCWVKTPGVCVLNDKYQNMGQLLSKCSEYIIISKCCYGSYSPFVKNIFDRSISYFLPYFNNIDGETHHKKRYDNRFSLSVLFYGNDVTEAEKETAKDLVAANSTNYSRIKYNVSFYDNTLSLKEGLQ